MKKKTHRHTQTVAAAVAFEYISARGFGKRACTGYGNGILLNRKVYGLQNEMK